MIFYKEINDIIGEYESVKLRWLFVSVIRRCNNDICFARFVQYLVNKDYFKDHPKHLDGIIRLLEHVVITFDLYQDEENLGSMYAFLYNFVKPIGTSHELVNILDQWRLGLFHMQVNQKY